MIAYNVADGGSRVFQLFINNTANARGKIGHGHSLCMLMVSLRWGGGYG